MELTNPVWGKQEIDEPVLIELLNCSTFLRLKGISQQGMPQEFHPTKISTRYEHSIGVFLTLRYVGADLMTQISGLLHDVSHTAFSHVADLVLGDSTKDDYQDSIHLRILENSEIPEILKRYGINYEDIAQTSNFPLLDKELPSLCADRFDYSISDMKRERILDEKSIEKIKESLVNINNNIAFNSTEIAEIFARAFMRCQNELWSEENNKGRYHLLAEALKEALSKGVINLEDFRKTDEEVMEKLRNTSERTIRQNLDILSNGFSLVSSDSTEAIILKSKFRFIDPEILLDGSIVPLSNLSTHYKEFLEKCKKEVISSRKVIIIPN